MRNTVRKDKAENEIREAKKKTKKISKQIYVYCFRKSFDIYIYIYIWYTEKVTMDIV